MAEKICGFTWRKPNQLVDHVCKLPQGHKGNHYCRAHQHEDDLT